MDSIISFFMGLDQKVVVAIVAVLVVFVVLAIIKKAIKLAALIAVVALLLGGGKGIANSVIEKYNFDYDESHIEFTLNGRDYNLELDTVNSITIEDGANGVCYLLVEFNDGTEFKQEVPSWSTGVIKGVAEKTGIEYHHKSYTGL